MSLFHRRCLSRRFLCCLFQALLLAVPVAMTPGETLAASTPPPGRLIFTAERIERLKADIAAGGEIADAWKKMLERADHLTEAGLVSRQYSETGAGQHGNYGRPSSQMADMGGTLGLACLVTGLDKYADKLRDAMLHYGTFDRWAGDAGHDPPWHSELNTARFCYGYAVGYDSIRSRLSAADRKTITAAMVRLGIRPTLDDWVLGDKRIHALDSMGHNWWSVCVAMAGLASLAAADDVPQAGQWASRVNEVFEQWFYYAGNTLQNKSTNFDAKGAFYESVSYANYALSEYLIFRLAWSSRYPHNPPPRIDLLNTAGDFFVHTCYPTSDSMLAVNFGDSSLNASGARTIRLLLADGYDKPAYRWYLSETDRGLKDPVALACGVTDTQKSPPAAMDRSFVYPDIGWAMMRSSWRDNATMLAVKSGFAWNHAHPDAGSFILFHRGKPLLIDSGNCSYSRREYSSYYRQSHAHNVILTDGRAGDPEACAGPDRGVVTPGTVDNLLQLDGLRYVMADATGPTSWKFSRNYRHFIWLDNVILIFDDIRTHQPGELEWLLHYRQRAEVDGSTISISNGDDAKVLVKTLYPAGLSVTEKQGLKDHDPDTKVTYLSLSPAEPRQHAKFITALLPIGDDGEKALPELKLLEDNDAVGVRIRDGDLITDVYLNLRADGRKMHRNSCNTIAGWQTDAYIFAITAKADQIDKPDSVKRCLVACGSYLRKDGQVVLDSLSKVYCAFETTDGAMNVQLQGQPLIDMTIRAPEKPAGLLINDKPQTIDYLTETGAVRLKVDNR